MTVAIHQVWRDRDKRMSSGRRFVRVVRVLYGDTHAECKPVYERDGVFVDHDNTRTTRLSVKTLRQRFELVRP